MIVQFEATIDDMVDVSTRSWANSKTMRLWRWQGAAATALMLALPAYFLLGESFGSPLLIACAAAVVGVALYLLTYKENFRKRTRKLCREQLGTDAPFTVTVELLDEGLSFNQMGARVTYEWPRIDRVVETADALYFFTKENACCAVRKRGFESVAIKDEFLKRAEDYIKLSRGPLCSKS
jgi:hypothetical protein